MEIKYIKENVSMPSNCGRGASPTSSLLCAQELKSKLKIIQRIPLQAQHREKCTHV